MKIRNSKEFESKKSLNERVLTTTFDSRKCIFVPIKFINKGDEIEEDIPHKRLFTDDGMASSNYFFIKYGINANKEYKENMLFGANQEVRPATIEEIEELYKIKYSKKD